MNTKDIHSPVVLILSQAMDVIRREAIKSDVETGGILVGSRSDDGAILVTHATPPGPNAVHNAVYFQRDVGFQQATLENLHEHYDVQYLGEWHKHPRSLPSPSSGDFTNVKELLSDPDYGVGDLLFPIVLCEKDFGFKLYPFYVATDELQSGFQPVKWYEVSLPIEADQVFSRRTSDIAVMEASNDASSKPSENHADKECLEGAGATSQWSRLQRYLPFCRRQDEKTQPKKPPVQCSNRPQREDQPSEETVQWYKVESGRQRLAREQKLLQSFGLVAEPFLTHEGQIGFCFARGCGREIVVVCASDHPRTAPRVLLRDGANGKHEPYNAFNWVSEHDYLADFIVPLLGPDMAWRATHEADTIKKRKRQQKTGEQL